MKNQFTTDTIKEIENILWRNGLNHQYDDKNSGLSVQEKILKLVSSKLEEAQKVGREEREKELTENALGKTQPDYFDTSRNKISPDRCGCVKSCYTSKIDKKTYCFCLHGKSEQLSKGGKNE